MSSATLSSTITPAQSARPETVEQLMQFATGYMDTEWGVLFDLEHVVTGAKPRIERQGHSVRCSIAHGDFFVAVPEGDA
jgi:hypothetical protein